MCHSPVKNRAARTVVLDTPAEENDAVNSPIITSPEKMPVPYVDLLFNCRGVHHCCFAGARSLRSQRQLVL
jgi:hypothetical protein